MSQYVTSASPTNSTAPGLSTMLSSVKTWCPRSCPGLRFRAWVLQLPFGLRYMLRRCCVQSASPSSCTQALSVCFLCGSWRVPSVFINAGLYHFLAGRVFLAVMGACDVSSHVLYRPSLQVSSLQRWLLFQCPMAPADPDSYKLLSAILLFLVALGGALLPRKASKLSLAAVRLCNAAAGGVLVAVALVHLLAESVWALETPGRALSTLLSGPDAKEFPLGFAICGLGFLTGASVGTSKQEQGSLEGAADTMTIVKQSLSVYIKGLCRGGACRVNDRGSTVWEVSLACWAFACTPSSKACPKGPRPTSQKPSSAAFARSFS